MEDGGRRCLRQIRSEHITYLLSGRHIPQGHITSSFFLFLFFFYLSILYPLFIPISLSLVYVPQRLYLCEFGLSSPRSKALGGYTTWSGLCLEWSDSSRPLTLSTAVAGIVEIVLRVSCCKQQDRSTSLSTYHSFIPTARHGL